MIAAVAYIVPAILFIMFGSGKVQKWNESKSSETDKTEATNAETAHQA